MSMRDWQPNHHKPVLVRSHCSKSNDRAEGDAQIIVPAVVEVDGITEFEPETDRAERGFSACRGIKCCIQVRSANAQYRAHVIDVGYEARAEAEVDETGFECGVGAKVPVGRLDHGSEESLRDADRGVLDGGHASIRNALIDSVEVHAVVVGEFTLEHHVGVDACAESSAESEVVGVGLRDVEGVEEDAAFETALRLQQGRNQEEQEGQDESDFTHSGGCLHLQGGVDAENKARGLRWMPGRQEAKQ